MAKPRRNIPRLFILLTNSSHVSSRNPLFCRPLKFLSQIAGRVAMSVISLSTSKLAKAASELIASSFSSILLLTLIFDCRIFCVFFWLFHTRAKIFAFFFLRRNISLARWSSENWNSFIFQTGAKTFLFLLYCFFLVGMENKI